VVPDFLLAALPPGGAAPHHQFAVLFFQSWDFLIRINSEPVYFRQYIIERSLANVLVLAKHCPFLSHGLALQFDLVDIVYQPVNDIIEEFTRP
jgi:hypothetical protein